MYENPLAILHGHLYEYSAMDFTISNLLPNKELIIICLVLQSGCARLERLPDTFGEKPLNADRTETVPSRSMIKGRIVFHEPEKPPVSMKGLEIGIIPSTPEATSILVTTAASFREDHSALVRLRKHSKIAYADEHGCFVFDNIPRGNYIIFAKVAVETPSSYGVMIVPRFLTAKCLVKENDVMEITLIP